MNSFQHSISNTQYPAANIMPEKDWFKLGHWIFPALRDPSLRDRLLDIQFKILNLIVTRLVRLWMVMLRYDGVLLLLPAEKKFSCPDAAGEFTGTISCICFFQAGAVDSFISFSVFELFPLALVPAGDRSEIADHSAVNFGFCSTFCHFTLLRRRLCDCLF